MDEVILICKACGAETVRQAKPEPKDGREAKQALFHCDNCGAVNLRDGTLRVKRGFRKPESYEEEDGGSGDGVLKAVVAIAMAVLTAVGFKAWKDSQNNQGQ